MKLKKYLNLFILLAIFAIALSMVTVKAYAKEKTSSVKLLKGFNAIVEGSKFYYGSFYDAETDCYVDSINNKIYINVEDFFAALEGTIKEAKIKVKADKKYVEVTTGKEYYGNYTYDYYPKSIYGKPENMKLNIDGKAISVKGYVVLARGYDIVNDPYSRPHKILCLDFDELAKKLDLIHDKDISKRKFLLFTKLPENVTELKTGKKPIESYEVYNNTSRYTDIYDRNFEWASRINNYLYEEDGNLVRIENREKDENNKKSRVIIERYDKNGKKIFEKNFEYKEDRFGGFYRGEEYNYLFFGNYNNKKNDKKEVIRIIKYDRKFNELAKLSIKGACTLVPFGCGSLRCAEIGDTVLVHTARINYNGHQTSLTIAFNEDTMLLLNADDLGEFQRNHVSNSFNQFVMADGNEFITVDHGDAYPRSILVSWLRTEAMEPEPGSPASGGGLYVTDRNLFSPSRKKGLLNIPGEIGFRVTGLSIGSAINLKNKVLVGINRIDYSKSEYLSANTMDIVLYSLDKNTLKVIEKKYTNYAKSKDITYSAPKMVKLDEARAMLIWNKINKTSEKNVLQYLIVDENGKKLSEIKTVKGMIIADETPIIYNNKVVWSQYSGGRLVLNQIPLK